MVRMMVVKVVKMLAINVVVLKKVVVFFEEFCLMKNRQADGHF